MPTHSLVNLSTIKIQLNFAEELDGSLSEAILDGYNIMVSCLYTSAAMSSLILFFNRVVA